jgi:hypothetical protein
MRKLSLAAVSAIALGAALSAPSLIARQQNIARFEYLRLTPYLGTVTSIQPSTTSPSGAMTPGSASLTPGGVRACVAASAEWTCRRFDGQASADDGFRTALVTLGSEGWELVSADAETPGAYLFKRQVQ